MLKEITLIPNPNINIKEQSKSRIIILEELENILNNIIIAFYNKGDTAGLFVNNGAICIQVWDGISRNLHINTFSNLYNNANDLQYMLEYELYNKCNCYRKIEETEKIILCGNI